MDSRRSPLEGIITKLGLDHPTFTLSVNGLGFGFIHGVFSFYYVKVFLNHYQITHFWFQIAQLLYLVWNAINDPLLAYYQDVVGAKWMKNRAKSVLYSAPLYALTSLLPWFGWGGPESPPWVVGLHLIISLRFSPVLFCIFGFIGLAGSALFVEFSTKQEDRVRLVKYGQVISLISLNGITIVEKVSNSLQNFTAFRIVTTIFAMLGCLCVVYTGLYAPQTSAQAQIFKHVNKAENGADTEETENAENESDTGFRQVWTLTKQVLKSRDFLSLALMNFLHSMRATFYSNFLAIFTEALIPRTILPLGSWSISLFYGIASTLPHVVVLCGSSLVNRCGPYVLMMISFGCGIAFSLVMLGIGKEYPYAIMIFMLLDHVLLHSFGTLIYIMYADVVDDDMIRHRRQSPISSIFFGMNALLTKPAESITPMIVENILGKRYSDYKVDKSEQDLEKYDGLKGSMFSTLCLFPLCLGIMQIFVFKWYRLTERHKVSAEDALLADDHANIPLMETDEDIDL